MNTTKSLENKTYQELTHLLKEQTGRCFIGMSKAQVISALCNKGCKYSKDKIDERWKDDAMTESSILIGEDNKPRPTTKVVFHLSKNPNEPKGVYHLCWYELHFPNGARVQFLSEQYVKGDTEKKLHKLHTTKKTVAELEEACYNLIKPEFQPIYKDAVRLLNSGKKSLSHKEKNWGDVEHMIVIKRGKK